MDIANKTEFIFFMQRACENQTNDCYIELYNILLRAFISADCDFDGQVSEEEFSGMIAAAAALPKKFGFDWWQGSPADQFKAIDENGDGGVSFDEWLGFAYTNYQTQCKALPAAFDKEAKDTFVKSCKESTDTASDAYKKIYWFSWKCFQAADADRDGQVSADEFPIMITIATANQVVVGLPAPYQTADEMAACFKAVDENGDGGVSYDEWLGFFLKDIIAPIAAL
jgi:Ca2+-binding EF-hand superfamily protein